MISQLTAKQVKIAAIRQFYLFEKTNVFMIVMNLKQLRVYHCLEYFMLSLDYLIEMNLELFIHKILQFPSLKDQTYHSLIYNFLILTRGISLFHLLDIA